MSDQVVVYIIDDMKEQLDLVSAMLSSSNYHTETFQSGLEFLELSKLSDVGCVLLDNHMPEISGLEVQLKLKQCGCDLPVVFMSGASLYNDVVEAVQEGALGFLQKPFTRAELLAQVKESIEESWQRQKAKDLKSEYAYLLESLTPRERQIYGLVITGHISKVISTELEITLGTVEFHRANLMKKLGANTLADLMAISLHSK